VFGIHQDMVPPTRGKPSALRKSDMYDHVYEAVFESKPRGTAARTYAPVHHNLFGLSNAGDVTLEQEDRGDFSHYEEQRLQSLSCGCWPLLLVQTR